MVVKIFVGMIFHFVVHHAGDLIALGSKPSGSKASLRHPVSDSDDPAKPSKSSSTLNVAAGGNPSKKFKAAASGDNSGVLFSDPIRVSQVSQPAVSKQASSSKGSHSQSPQPSGGSGAQQIIEGDCSGIM